MTDNDPAYQEKARPDDDPLQKAAYTDPPPFFQTWSGMYGLVIGVFVGLVILFYLFTKAYE
jgi:hypothetical protein